MADSSFPDTALGGSGGIAGAGGAAGSGASAGAAGADASSGGAAGAGGDAGTVKPSDIPGLVLWLRGDLGLTAAAGRVSAWSDQSGQSNHYSETVASYLPTISSSIGGKQTVFFDGVPTPRRLLGPQLPLSSGATLVVVLKLQTAPVAGFSDVFNNTGPTAFRFGLTESASFSNVYFGAQGYLVRGTFGLDVQPHLYQLTWDGTSPSQATAYELHVDGTSIPVSMVGGTPTVPPTSAVGAFATGGASKLNGEIGELLAYDRKLNGNELDSLGSALKQFWSIP